MGRTEKAWTHGFRSRMARDRRGKKDPNWESTPLPFMKSSGVITLPILVKNPRGFNYKLIPSSSFEFHH